MLQGVWEVFRRGYDERQGREIDRTLRILQECVAEVSSDGQGDAYTRQRLGTMLEFLRAMSGVYEEVLRLPPGALKGLVKMRGQIRGQISGQIGGKLRKILGKS